MNSACTVPAVALVVVATVLVGAFGLRVSRTTSDFYVASRTVGPRLNAAAISGEYLSAASFLGIAGLVLVQGPDMLWPVALPFLCLQPLVENAVKHGLEGRTGTFRIRITARDAGAEALVVIEDDGAGMDPRLLRRILAGEDSPSGGIGLSNVDDRLRQVYGDDHGLVLETAPGAGMKITVRLPKYHPGVHSAARPGNRTGD